MLTTLHRNLFAGCKKRCLQTMKSSLHRCKKAPLLLTPPPPPPFFFKPADRLTPRKELAFAIGSACYAVAAIRVVRWKACPVLMRHLVRRCSFCAATLFCLSCMLQGIMSNVCSARSVWSMMLTNLGYKCMNDCAPVFMWSVARTASKSQCSFFIKYSVPMAVFNASLPIQQRSSLGWCSHFIIEQRVFEC